MNFKSSYFRYESSYDVYSDDMLEYRNQYRNDSFKISLNKEDRYYDDKKIINVDATLNQICNYLGERDKENFIRKNLSYHPYIAIYYLPKGDFTLSLVYEVLINTLNYFKSFCPKDLEYIYHYILAFYNFDEKQLKTILIKMFNYNLLKKFVMNIASFRISSLKVKFIIWFLGKDNINHRLIDLFTDLIDNYHALNKYEQKVLREHGGDYFITIYKIGNIDKKLLKKIYDKVINICIDKSAEINLTLFSFLCWGVDFNE